MRTPHIRTYALVALAKAWLNHLKKAVRSPPVEVLGRSNKAARAGLSVSAWNAEGITEVAIVPANCGYRQPVMPGRNAVGMNTGEGTRAISTTAPEISSMAMR